MVVIGEGLKLVDVVVIGLKIGEGLKLVDVDVVGLKIWIISLSLVLNR